MTIFFITLIIFDDESHETNFKMLELLDAIKAGIRKMNIGTDVCCAFADGTKKTIDDPKRSLAVDLFMKPAIESVKALALDKIKLVGADNKVK